MCRYWRYVGYFAMSLHPREEKFGCYHSSKACLEDLKKPCCTKLPVAGFLKKPVKYVTMLI